MKHPAKISYILRKQKKMKNQSYKSKANGIIQTTFNELEWNFLRFTNHKKKSFNATYSLIFVCFICVNKELRPSCMEGDMILLTLYYIRQAHRINFNFSRVCCLSISFNVNDLHNHKTIFFLTTWKNSSKRSVLN